MFCLCVQEAAKAREKEDRDRARAEGRRTKGPQDDLELLSDLQEELARLQEGLPALEQEAAREGAGKKGAKAWGEGRGTPGPEVSCLHYIEVVCGTLGGGS
jgi:hypothetical protein